MSSTHLSDPEIFALVDCNSFFCSCERVFNPAVRKKPVIVLSSNDGCAVSLTPDAKALGIPMGAPIFKYKDLVKKHGIQIFSSNFALYGDLSSRVMATLAEFTPELEIYSIDEAFLSLRGFSSRDLIQYASEIKSTVYQYTGIPVSVGIGPTKVLAKAANRIAKKMGSGVFNLTDEKLREEMLATLKVGDLWGIGSRSAEKLNRIGLLTARDFKNASSRTVRDLLGVVGHRLQEELRGVSCLSLAHIAPDKKQMISSRSFGKPVFDLELLKEAVANHVTQLCERLREQKAGARMLQVFIHTNRFKDAPQYFKMSTQTLLSAENTTNVMIKVAFQGLEEIYRDGFEYKKCGVILNDILSTTPMQQSLFSYDADSGGMSQACERNERMMEVLDHINAEMGSGTLKFAACGVQSSHLRSGRLTKKDPEKEAYLTWKAKNDFRSPRYTTAWDELLVIGSGR